MAEVLYNNEGVPMMGFGKSFFMATSGTPEFKHVANPKDQTDDLGITVDKYKVAPWTETNDFPQTASEIIKKVGVLNTGLRFTRNFTIGQGIFPVKVKGYDDNGSVQLEVYNEPKINRFIKGRVVRRYLEKTGRDYFKFGCAFPQILLNQDHSKIVGILFDISLLDHVILTQEENQYFSFADDGYL